MGNGRVAAAGGRTARTRRAPVARRRALPAHLGLFQLSTSLPRPAAQIYGLIWLLIQDSTY